MAVSHHARSLPSLRTRPFGINHLDDRVGGPRLSTIAAVKALLVAFFFMQLREAPRTAKLAATAGLVWLAFLALLGAADFGLR